MEYQSVMSGALPPLTQTTTSSEESSAMVCRSTIAQRVYLLGIVLLILAIGPLSWISGPLLKLSLFSLCLLIAAAFFVVAGGVRGFMQVRGKIGILLVGLLPVLYLISWRYSLNASAALTGIGSEIDTVLFVAIGFLALLMSFMLIRSVAAARRLILVIVGASLVAVLFQYFVILTNARFLPSSIFTDRTINLVGKWNDLSLLVSIGAVLIYTRLLMGNMRTRALWIAIVGLVLSLGLLFVINFNIAWWLLLGGSLLVSLFHMVYLRKSRREDGFSSSKLLHMYWLGIILVIFSIVGGGWGSSINSYLPGIFAIPSLEVRPAFSTTYAIAQQAHTSAGRLLIGTGPNTFENQWLAYKPLGAGGVNETQFWSIDFITGFSVLATAFAATGFLGLLVWCIPIVLVLVGFWRLLRISGMSEEKFFVTLKLGLVAFLLWVSAALYATSQDMLLLAFISTGAFYALTLSLRSVPEGAPGAYGGGLRIISMALAVILVAFTLWSAFVPTRLLLASSYATRASLALSASDLQSATSYNARSQSIQLLGSNLRLGVEIDLAKVQALLAVASTSSADVAQMRSQLQALLADAINVEGQGAVTLDPQNYQSYVELTHIYDALVPLNIQGAYQSDVAAYQAAISHDPTNPILPLLLARLEATENLQQNKTDVQNLLAQSLKLKSNYTDALLFAEQLAVAENDLPTATAAAKAVVASAPTQAPLWFQLGLFYYVGNDIPDAVTALEQAVSLVPNYANAKYFLGLSYDLEGRTQDALTQFQAIAQTNPTNTDIQSIIANLKAGKQPFAGSNPPATAKTAATRSHAPIKE